MTQCSSLEITAAAATYPHRFLHHSSCTPDRISMHAQRVEGDTFPRSFIKWSRICVITHGGGRALWPSKTLPTTRRRRSRAFVMRRAGSPALKPRLLEAQPQQKCWKRQQISTRSPQEPLRQRLGGPNGCLPCMTFSLEPRCEFR